jgi:hypothetical protein
VGFFDHIFGNTTSVKETFKRRQSLRQRICRIEEVESRELLSATPYTAPDPINVGIVYHEDYYEGLNDDEGDAGGDTFIISWNGGADGTTLDKVIIDLNKNSAYPNSSSVHFNIAEKFQTATELITISTRILMTTTIMKLLSNRRLFLTTVNF